MNTPRLWRRDALIAILLATLLGAVWTARQWADLSALRLPDTDDVTRLVQVRDWLGGQAFGDVHQYRLGPPGGTAMHWSRLADMPLAGLILLLRPLFGNHAAEIGAVIFWPIALFAASLTLVAAVARRMGVGSAVAMVVAAIAYPVTTLFAPGRIDHHGLQIVLLLACVHGMVAPATRWRGVAIGAAMVASAAIGFETLPSLVIVGLWAALAWVRGGDARLEGLAIGLVGFGIAAIGLVPASAPAGLCDALSVPLATLLAACGGTFALVIIAHRLTVLPRPVLLISGGIALGTVMVTLLPSGCDAGPYGEVDPLAARLWLAQVAEAQPLFAAMPGDAIGYAGLALVGLAVALWQAALRGKAWWALAALIGAGLAVACWQLRGAYPAAALAPIALARLIDVARARGTAALASAWMVSAGTLYSVAAGAVAQPAASAVAPCDAGAVTALLDSLPPGRVAAPIDLAPPILRDTRDTALAGPYHRNGAGNAALYRAMLGPPQRAWQVLRGAAVDYVVWCPDAVHGPAAPGSLARRGVATGFATVARAGSVTVLARR